MRTLLILLVAIPAITNAIGADSCHLHGKLNGKQIALEFMTDESGKEGYGSKKYRNYGICDFSIYEQRSPYPKYLKCSGINTSSGPTYQLELKYSKGELIEQGYICISGCTEKYVKRFIYSCEDDC